MYCVGEGEGRWKREETISIQVKVRRKVGRERRCHSVLVSYMEHIDIFEEILL